MTDRPVLIQYPGQTDTYEVASPEVAEQLHPDAEIIRYADSFEPYGKYAVVEESGEPDEPEQDEPAKANEPAKATKKASNA